MERTPVTNGRLASLLQGSKVEWDLLEQGYGPLLRLVEKLLGVVPNCDRYLEIWPPAFRTYNVLVPNMLNLPAPVLGVGGPAPGVVGLAMYVASRTAGCPYCSVHSCSFAMRRGAPPQVLASVLRSRRCVGPRPGRGPKPSADRRAHSLRLRACGAVGRGRRGARHLAVGAPAPASAPLLDQT